MKHIDLKCIELQTLRKIAIVIICGFSLLSCENKEYVYIKDYLSDNGVTAQVTGAIGEVEFDEEVQFVLFGSYMESECTGRSIYFKRFSKDYQSDILFGFEVNQDGDYLFDYMSLDLRMKKGTKIIRVSPFYSDYQEGCEVQDMVYDSESGKLTFNYTVTIVDGRNDLDLFLSGSADVQIYDYQSY